MYGRVLLALTAKSQWVENISSPTFSRNIFIKSTSIHESFYSKSDLISESFSTWLYPTKTVQNH